jgi:hypothetical protein
VLQHLATSAPATPATGALDRAGEQDPLRLVQMSLEVGQAGPLVDRALARAAHEGRFDAVLRLLASPPAESGVIADQLRARLAAPAAVAVLAAREPLDSDALDQLFPQISLDGYAALLDALEASPIRSTRRKLLDRLGRTVLDVGPLIAARLDDERWYVVRNMLVLLQRLKHPPPGFSPAPWTQHMDARVRLEAIQLQLTMPAENAQAVEAAIQDPDPRIMRLGLAAIQRKCPGPLTPPVAGIAVDGRMVEELRILAIRALGRSGDQTARDTLLHLVDGGRTLLGRPRLAAPTPICVAAVRSLSVGWRRDSVAMQVLTLARSSSHAELREAAEGGVP